MYRTTTLLIAASILFVSGTVSAWTAPTGAAPGSHGSTPLNAGSANQTKNGNLGVNGLSVFGTTLLSGLNVGTGRYLNFDYTSGGTSGTGSAGYGIWDNAGTLNFKNIGGSWQSLQAIVSGLVSGGGAWTTNGANIYNSNTGNVGIGTASPSQMLEVSGANAGSANRGGVRIDDRGDGCCSQLTMTSGSSRWDTYAYAGGGYSIYQVNHANGTAGLGQLLTVADNGNVGIGTASPLSKLHVTGGAMTSFTGAGAGTLLVDAPYGASGNQYRSLDFTHGGPIPFARIASLDNGNGSYLQFGTSNSYATGITNTAMTIDPSGNVGIGTVPGYKLDVAGNGHFSSTLLVNIAGRAISASSMGAGDWSGCFGSDCVGPPATQYGIYANGSVWAGEFSGNVYVTGYVQAANSFGGLFGTIVDTGACNWPNPLTGGCSCPGYAPYAAQADIGYHGSGYSYLYQCY